MKLRPAPTVLLWTILLLIAHWTPGDSMPDDAPFPALPEGADKIGHALLFSVETLWLQRWLDARGRRRPLAAAALAAGLLAVVTEVVQIPIPGRSADIADLLADGLGIAAGAAWASVRPSSSTEIAT